MNRLLTRALSLACLSAATALAGDTAEPTTHQQVLRVVPSAELPAKAVELVKQVTALDRATRTSKVTKDAVVINPASAPSVVGAIARAIPEMAAVAAGTAAAAQPKQATVITKAAVAAAPSQTGKIVAAICRSVPKEYRSIAITAAQIAPDSANDILQGVASSIPELKPGLEAALAAYSGRFISVATALDQASAVKIDPGSLAEAPPRGPTVAPPFIPISSTVRTISPNTSAEVPTGGRDYGTP